MYVSQNKALALHVVIFNALSDLINLIISDLIKLFFFFNLTFMLTFVATGSKVPLETLVSPADLEYNNEFCLKDMI